MGTWQPRNEHRPSGRRLRVRRALTLAAGLLGCTELSGRAPVDAAAVDASAVDASAVDVAQLGDGASRCAQGSKVSVTRATHWGTATPGGMFSMPSARAGWVDAAGRLVVAGQCVGCGAERLVASRLAVWRFDAATLALDPSFGAGGAFLDADASRRMFSEALGVISGGDGRLLVFGHDSAMGNNNRAVLLRLNADGTLDPSFAEGGRLALPRTVFGSPRPVVAFAGLHDARGTVLLVNDGGHWAYQSQSAWAVRVDDTGALDASFGIGGVVALSSSAGCFDLAAQGEGYVLACITLSLQPQLVRLDGRGQRAPWPMGEAGVATQAPQRFEVRSLDRDSRGRWLVAGAWSPIYNDIASVGMAVRFSAEGAPDRGYGADGLATAFGPRCSFAYGFRDLATLTCDDRLVFGGNIDAEPTAQVFNADGRALSALGDQGIVRLAPTGERATANAVVPIGGTNDLVVIASAQPETFSLYRLSQ